MAERYGFYVLLLPVWDRNNLLWCLGGDRMPLHRGTDYRPVWRALAEGLALGLTGRAMKYDQDRAAWKELLITYHPCREVETGLCSTFSYWTDEEAWISFIMLQSGHGLNVKNYDLVAAEYGRAQTMSVWYGEPAYEGMPTSWPVVGETSFHGAKSVRTRAFFSLLAGAFGYTYGHASVWCMVSEKDKNAVSRLSWYEVPPYRGHGADEAAPGFSGGIFSPGLRPLPTGPSGPRRSGGYGGTSRAGRV